MGQKSTLNPLLTSISKHISLGRQVELDCSHRDQIQDVSPSAEGCGECLAIGDTWVHLRMCMTCGQIGCCNDSKNKHAAKHFMDSDHPIVRSFEPGEDWMWCYVDATAL
jgi:uncharacterized UBP type Zn finger protein